jgi:hypothetical protein
MHVAAPDSFEARDKSAVIHRGAHAHHPNGDGVPD